MLVLFKELSFLKGCFFGLVIDGGLTGGDALPFRSAFKDVIFCKSSTLSTDMPEFLQDKMDQEESVLLHFKICCPNVEEGTTVYVIGSSTELGHWKVQVGLKEMPWRGAGVAIPMFSVRSEVDLGVGEFLDLKSLVDWAVESVVHLVQLLLINDTSVHRMWWDSYPYSSLSVFALHPLYLRVLALSKNMPEDIKNKIRNAKERLVGKDVDYEATLATKLSIAKKVFIQEKDLILNSSSFNNFFSENEVF
ncbi:hypothetical protein REPUB_Repub06bG0104400 [Reevesia pubescens]